MPPPLPDRFSLEVRLGRDQDIEEWLATDTALDRPVLIRVLGPETSAERRESFVEATRSAAGTAHVHLVSVYAAGLLEEGAYSVTEWAGGVSIADRLAAGETIPVDEFLPNAAGLADGLAALHRAGVIHGGIDTNAVFFAASHPAKLGSFGRPHAGGSVAQDTRALAETLEQSITGRPVGSSTPSQVVDGIPAAVDQALEQARRGDLDAAGLARALHATTRIPEIPRPGPGWSWRWLAPAAVLSILAVGIVAIGLVLTTGPDAPILFPPSASTTTITIATTTTTSQPDANPVDPTVILRAFAYDPEGDGSEHDQNVPRVIDGDPSTAWRTERYFDPLPLLKRGVGVAVEVTGSPEQLVATGMSSGTAYALMWSSNLPAEGVDGWERLVSGTVTGQRLTTQLPPREGGFWLLWFTDLPAQEDGFYAELAEVRFLP